MPLKEIKSLAVKLSVVAMIIASATSAQQYMRAITPVIPDVARPLPLSAVRLTGGPLKRAQDLDAEYLLKLEPDRMLAYYRKRAGLEPKARGLRRLGRRRQKPDRPYRRALLVRREL